MSAEQQRRAESSSPAPHFLTALQQRKSFNACSEPQQLSDCYWSDSCSFARMKRGKRCAWSSCETLNFAWNWWKRFLLAQVRGQQTAQEMPRSLCPPWGRHKDATLAYLLCALIWPRRISCITLLLQQGGTRRKPWSFTDLTANSQHSENSPSQTGIPPHSWCEHPLTACFQLQPTTSSQFIALGLLVFHSRQTKLHTTQLATLLTREMPSTHQSMWQFPAWLTLPCFPQAKERLK